MENKINIAELLKDCPQGMELDCTTFDNVRFQCVSNDGIWIEYIDPDNNKRIVHLTYYGGFKIKNIETKCVIFPKGKTTWEGFHRPFKDGDIIFTHIDCLKVGLDNTWISIYQENRNGGVATYVDYAEDGSDFYSCKDKGLLCMNKDIMRQRLATEEEKQKLFDAIKANGYCWNTETKTLEKLIEPKFKVGDRITSDKINLGTIYNIIEVKESLYIVNKNNETDDYRIDFVNQDYWELVLNKFDITTLKPFESRVLVRDANCYEWEADIFGRYSDGYITLGGGKWKQCIPYEGNEHLLGKTDDCDDFYKT